MSHENGAPSSRSDEPIRLRRPARSAMSGDVSAMDRPLERPRGLSRGGILGVAAGVAAVVGLALLVPTIRRWARAEKAVAASSVRLGTVVKGTLVRDASAQGRIVAALHPTLFSPAQGIVALAVKAGATVKKGQLLARIESPELKSRLAQERSTLAVVRSSLGRQKIEARQQAFKDVQNVALLELRLEAARRLLERAQRTFDEGILNRTDYEKAKDDVKIAEMELANARQAEKLDAETGSYDIRDKELQEERQASAVTELQRQVDQLVIVAPFDGMVATVSVQDRDAVAANAPVVTIVNLAKFEVEITLPENYAVDALPGASARILYEGREYPGRVTAISPEIKDSQVTGTVVFDGEPPSGLRQSQRVSVRMVFEDKPNVLKLPRGPFLESGAGRQAYVVADGIATRKDIAVGAISVSEVEIIRGLAEGDKVVLSDTSEFAGARTVLIRN
jgi:HlyD family secretion protein